jgi:hypothetical protein
MKKILFGILAIALVAFIVFFAASNMTYSDGKRMGYLMKISKKGVLFKTYEGELNLNVASAGDVTAVMGSNIWAFSVISEEVYQDLQKYEGKAVKLSYKQKMRSFPWQGDTDYFVYEVEALEKLDE